MSISVIINTNGNRKCILGVPRRGASGFSVPYQGRAYTDIADIVMHNTNIDANAVLTRFLLNETSIPQGMRVKQSPNNRPAISMVVNPAANPISEAGRFASIIQALGYRYSVELFTLPSRLSSLPNEDTTPTESTPQESEAEDEDESEDEDTDSDEDSDEDND